MERIPWPTTHTGLTPADIPKEYSAFTTIWDDHRGYEPKIVGREIDDHGREVILIALSPGVMITTTLISAGSAPEDSAAKAVAAIKALRERASLESGLAPPEATADPASGHDTREANL